MSLKDSLIVTANINLGYANLLTKDVTDELGQLSAWRRASGLPSVM